MTKKTKRALFGLRCRAAGRIADALNVQPRHPPLFIVGTGRCGTSLLVRILRSHPSIEGFPGEANHLWHPNSYPYEQRQIETEPLEVDPERFTALSVGSWPPGHARRIRRTLAGFHWRTGTEKVLFVKSAMISLMIPEILSIFPDARFIHIYRYGPSVIGSLSKWNREKQWTKRYTEEECYRLYARYWNCFVLAVEQAKASLLLDESETLLELSYETLCDDPEGTLERLASFVGVDRREFRFDLTTIQNRNFKVREREDAWDRRVYDDMSPAMKLKGYLS